MHSTLQLLLLSGLVPLSRLYHRGCLPARLGTYTIGTNLPVSAQSIQHGQTPEVTAPKLPFHTFLPLRAGFSEMFIAMCKSVISIEVLKHFCKHNMLNIHAKQHQVNLARHPSRIMHATISLTPSLFSVKLVFKQMSRRRLRPCLKLRSYSFQCMRQYQIPMSANWE